MCPSEDHERLAYGECQGHIVRTWKRRQYWGPRELTCHKVRCHSPKILQNVACKADEAIPIVTLTMQSGCCQNFSTPLSKLTLSPSGLIPCDCPTFFFSACDISRQHAQRGVEAVTRAHNSRGVGLHWASCTAPPTPAPEVGPLGSHEPQNYAFPCTRNPIRADLGSDGIMFSSC
jgi:hypothetical protein